MKTCSLTLALLIATMAGLDAAYAAMPPHNHEMQHAVAQIKHEGSGVLKAVDAEAGKVKIAHEAIPALNWPGMTMWFALQAPLPPEISVGNSVRFELQQGATKEWVIARIERKM